MGKHGRISTGEVYIYSLYLYIYTIINKLYIYSSIEFYFLIFRSHPQFASDFRNVRLALASDRFSPYRSTAVPYSAWPIIAMSYNLPPSLCMKKEFNMLVMLISGPKSPGKCLNVLETDDRGA